MYNQIKSIRKLNWAINSGLNLAKGEKSSSQREWAWNILGPVRQQYGQIWLGLLTALGGEDFFVHFEVIILQILAQVVYLFDALVQLFLVVDELLPLCLDFLPIFSYFGRILAQFVDGGDYFVHLQLDLVALRVVLAYLVAYKLVIPYQFVEMGM